MRRGLSRHNNRSGGNIFSPLSLFSGGAQGVWYDDSLTSSMYQDSAGTIAAVLESPVGKQLDLSGNNNHRTQTTSANRPTLSARYNLLTDTAVLATQNITTVATSYTIYFTGSGTVTLSGTYIGVFTAGTNTFTATAGTLTATVVGSVLTADIRPTNQTTTLPAYQYVTSSTVYDTVGFPQYLRYTTGNASLFTANVNLTVTTKIALFSGARKLSAVSQILLEHSTNATILGGGFNLASDAGNYNYTIGSFSGADGFLSSVTYTEPITNVIFVAYNNATSNNPNAISPRINTATPTVGSSTTIGIAQGQFANAAFYFGARGGSSLFFNGYEYQTIIVGKTLTATEISNTETYVNSKTLAY